MASLFLSHIGHDLSHCFFEYDFILFYNSENWSGRRPRHLQSFAWLFA